MTKQDKTTDTSDNDRERNDPDIVDDRAGQTDPADSDLTDGDLTDGDPTDTADDAADAPAGDVDAEEAPRPRTKAARVRSDRRASTSADADKAVGEKAGAVDTPSSAAGRGRQISLTVTTGGLLKTLGVLVVVAALVGVALLGWGYHRQSEELAAFDASKSASEQFVTKLVGAMTKDGVADMKNELGPLSTGDFRKHLEQQQSDTAQAVTQLNLQDAESAVKSVSVERFDADSARTSVLVEVSGKSALAPEGGKSLMLLWLDLSNQDGQWLVSQVSGAQAGIGPEQGGQTGGQPTAPAPAAPAPAPAG
ncbi:hypothetical protein [Gordonia insulae]|uniref:Mce-associated membrane protein n=1 Tax=Gordonia insulae TaxID=2420509 RepID=A0A3G8JGU1_9ACTN|nr:hypothetical protein [Gordonia insulae]AZG43742.1 hypothetical protein D7316_00311 [Gordonia insulae]